MFDKSTPEASASNKAIARKAKRMMCPPKVDVFFSFRLAEATKFCKRSFGAARWHEGCGTPNPCAEKLLISLFVDLLTSSDLCRDRRDVSRRNFCA
jgi:hypothetical protein